MRESRSPWAVAFIELLAVGGLTPFLFPLSWVLRRRFGLDGPEYVTGFLFFYGAYIINDPHFAVTYLLFYRDARNRAFGNEFEGLQRVRYLLAGFIGPALLFTWGLGSLLVRSPTALGGLVQVMFFLVGWHYVKQGFGVLTVLAARKGVYWRPYERLVLLAHAFSGWAYAWASPADPGRLVEEKGVVYTTVAHGRWLEQGTHVVFLLTVPLLLGVFVAKRLREGRLPIAAGLVAFVCSIWSWTIYSSIDPLVRYVTPALHSVQYLYFVWLLRGAEAREREGPPWFEPSRSVRLGALAVGALLLGAFFFHVAPSTLDALLTPKSSRTSSLGATPYFAALYAFVNIHHYLMDAVLWRRENPETRYLLAT